MYGLWWKTVLHNICLLYTSSYLLNVLNYPAYPKILTRSLNNRNTISTIKNISPIKCTMPSFSGGTGSVSYTHLVGISIDCENFFQDSLHTGCAVLYQRFSVAWRDPYRQAPTGKRLQYRRILFFQKIHWVCLLYTSSSILRIVDFLLFLAEVNALKSCSPSKSSAASRMASRFRFSGSSSA